MNILDCLDRILSFFSIQEEDVLCPEIGDECITADTISSDKKGLVEVKKPLVDKKLVCFALSNEGVIAENTQCIVMQVKGGLVIIGSKNGQCQEPRPKGRCINAASW